MFNRFYINRHRFAFYAEGGLYLVYYHQWQRTAPEQAARSDVFPYFMGAVGTTIKLSPRASLDLRVDNLPLAILGNGTWNGTPFYLGLNIHLP